MINLNIPRADYDPVPSLDPTILQLALDPLNEAGMPEDKRNAAFAEATRLAGLDRIQNRRVVKDSDGQDHWAAEYPTVFTFDNEHRGGVLTSVVIETDAGERILVRKTSGEAQDASNQTFDLISTGMAKQAAERGKVLQPCPIATETLAGVVLVPGLPMQLGYDPHTNKTPSSLGNITRITGLQMDKNGLVGELQQPERYTDARQAFNDHLEGIGKRGAQRIGARVLQQVNKHGPR